MCHTVCASAAEFDDHLKRAHFAPAASTTAAASSSAATTTSGTATAPPSMAADEVALFRDMWQRPAATVSAAECPFCGDGWAADVGRARQHELLVPHSAAVAPDAGGPPRVSAARFCRHVGRHLEQLALATLRASPNMQSVVQAVDAYACADSDTSDLSDDGVDDAVVWR